MLLEDVCKVLGLLAADGFVYSKTNQVGITLIDYGVNIQR